MLWGALWLISGIPRRFWPSLNMQTRFTRALGIYLPSSRYLAGVWPNRSGDVTRLFCVDLGVRRTKPTRRSDSHLHTSVRFRRTPSKPSVTNESSLGETTGQRLNERSCTFWPEIWLRGLDSNQDSRLQRPMCYQLHHPGSLAALNREEHLSVHERR